jgi:ribonuclease HI
MFFFILLIKIKNTIVMVKVYTDGSCTKNGKKEANGGIGVYFGPNNDSNISMSFDSAKDKFYDKYSIIDKIGVATNNKCELLAILMALEECEEMLKNGEKLTICSDSMYSIKCCTLWSMVWEKNNWKTSQDKDVLNKVIIQEIRNYIKEYENLINFKYVPSHTSKPHEKSEKYEDWFGNFEADRLACQK